MGLDAATTEDPARYSWTVTSRVDEAGPGKALVTGLASNAVAGLNPFQITMEWQPGMEAQDIQAAGLVLLAKLYHELAAELLVQVPEGSAYDWRDRG